MASKSLGTLTLDIVAQVGGFVAGMDKAERASKKWRRQVERDLKSAGSFMGKALATGAAAAAAGLTIMVKRSMEAIDAQSEMSKRLKTSYESLTTLGRAGEMAGVGMKQIETASRALEVNLGKASQGTKAQADALAKLQLNAEDLAKLPLDEKLTTINKTLIENVSVTERAAVASQLFGSRSQAAIQQLSPDLIAEAARQVEIFGLNLSDVDAEKVEMAADAMGTFGLLAKGVGQQLTVELAPVISAVGDEFLRSAEAAGGLGTVVQNVTRDGVRALAFMVDAVDGVRVTFNFAARAIGLVGANVVEYLSKAASTAAGLAKYTPQGAAFNLISGGKLEQAKRDLAELAGMASAVGDEFVALTEKELSTPLKGQQLLDFYDKAQKAGLSAAEAAAKLRKELGNTSAVVPVESEAYKEAEAAAKRAQEQAKQAAEAINDAFHSTEEGYLRQLRLSTEATEAEKLRFEITSGNLVGINEGQQKRLLGLADELDATEKLRKAQEDYKSLTSELRTEEEKLTDQVKERLAVLQVMPNIPEQEREQVKSRIAAAAFGDAPDFAGLTPEVGGALGEAFKINDAQAELEEWYAQRLEMLAKNRKNLSELNAQWDEQEVALAKEHADKLNKIDQARALVAYSAMEEMFGSLSGAVKQFAGEQSDAYKVLFAAEKAAAIARSIVAIQTALAQASASAPFPANLAAMATVAAQTASIIATISSASIQGQAHDGLMSVPKTGTYLLEKGERVTTADTSAKLDRTLEQVKTNREAANQSQSIRIVNVESTDAFESFMGSQAGERIYLNHMRRNRRLVQTLESGGA